MKGKTKLGELTAAQLFERCNVLEVSVEYWKEASRAKHLEAIDWAGKCQEYEEQLSKTKEYYEQVMKDGEVQIKKHKQLAEEYKKDAERYRWLSNYFVGVRTDMDDSIVYRNTVLELNKVIDKAIQEEHE